MGKLRGILLTPALRSAIEEVLALPQTNDENAVPLAEESDDAVANTDSTTKASTNASSSARSTAITTPTASLAQVKEAKQNLLSCSLSVGEACSLLEATCDNYDTGDATAVLPLEQIAALKLLINKSSSAEATKLLPALEQSLRPAALIFDRPAPQPSNNAAFEKRLAYLRQLNEERSYLASTSNIQKLNAHSTQDDVNVKSMMYATSVGLNMIVAPITFGVFMYFFAGSLFGRFFPDNQTSNNHNNNNVDIRQVIAGVLSGVILLFIEMILFVIRSHELDASVRKKKRKKEYKSNPFGYTSRAMERVYEGQMD